MCAECPSPGLATGTILYVVFFEVFPKAQEVGGHHPTPQASGPGL